MHHNKPSNLRRRILKFAQKRRRIIETRVFKNRKRDIKSTTATTKIRLFLKILKMQRPGGKPYAWLPKLLRFAKKQNFNRCAQNLRCTEQANFTVMTAQI